MTLPDHLVPIVDAVVEHALRGAPVPEQLPTLIEWYEDPEHYDLYPNDDLDHSLALNLSPSLTHWFTDGDVLAQLNPTARILDSHRTKFARRLIAERWADGQAPALILDVQLESRRGEQAVLGWLSDCRGEAVPFFQGIFRDMDAFFEFLRQSGYLLKIGWDEPDVTDETILRLWQYDT
jgi:hypothetical protein